MTLIELLVVLAVLALLAALVLSEFLHKEKEKAMRISCVSNLRQTGMAFRVWEGDNNDKYPMQVAGTNGGTMEFITGPNAFRHFQVMSNELNTPVVLFCPSDSQVLAKDFHMFSNAHLSYFTGVDAVETNSEMFLTGDRNITNGTLIRNNLLELTTNSPASWTAKTHVKAGNILLTDGSVRQADTMSLRTLIEASGVTNRLQMP